MMFVQSLHGISHNKIEDQGGTSGNVRHGLRQTGDKAISWIASSR
jgi:hypothetical protein